MTIHLGNVPAGSTLYIPFHTFASTGASVTITGLAVTDIEIYKNGSVTQRSSDAGYALLDTDGIDFDGITGIHGFSVDLSDNTDASFFAVGSQYWVVVSAITANAVTVNFVAAMFRIVAAEATVGVAPATVAALSDNRAEPGQGAPAASTSALAKLDYLYKAWRNKKEQTEHKLFADDASTVDQKTTVSDNGTTTTVGEMISGA
jgi:hypothetical protein